MTEDSGPLFKEMSIEKNKAVISFTHCDGLYSAGEKLTCFEIAGDDKVFFPAEAKIKGQQVVVQSKMVKSPAFVRFAWGNTATPNLFNSVKLPDEKVMKELQITATPNLFNGAKLPASCFITE